MAHGRGIGLFNILYGDCHVEGYLFTAAQRVPQVNYSDVGDVTKRGTGDAAIRRKHLSRRLGDPGLFSRCDAWRTPGMKEQASSGNHNSLKPAARSAKGNGADDFAVASRALAADLMKEVRMSGRGGGRGPKWRRARSQKGGYCGP